jgi:ADP-heptose:LPS heptosyltransferase/glycosyltransferase involved in cell wall biosynthesis
VKILILNSIGRLKWGGGEKWMLLAAKGLIAKGHEVFIGCHRHSVLAQKATAEGIRVTYFDIYSDVSLSGAIQLIRFCRQQPVDAIIGCQNRDVRVSGLVRRFIGNPIVLSRQGVKLIENSWKHKFTFTRFCDGIITNTQTIKDDYDSYGWWDNDFVKVIHNGVEAPSNSDEAFDYSRFIPSNITDPVIVLSAGRLSNQKGYNFLIDAARDVCTRHNNVFFFIAGHGKLQRKLEDQICALGLEKHVFLLGFQKSLVPLFKRANLFVLSSLYEGMPNVVMEAMINKVPVISTQVNGVSELMRQELDGFIVAPGDKTALTNAIEQFLALSDKQALVSNAYERVTDQFSVGRMVDNLEQFLLAKTQNRGPKRCLVIQTAFIGDVILATSVVEKLKERFPDTEIDFLLRKGNEGLLTDHPHLRNTIIFDKQKGKYRNLLGLLKKIRHNRYDLVVNIQRYATTGFLTALSGAKSTVGFSKNPLSRFFTYRIDHHMSEAGGMHEVDRNTLLLNHLDITQSAKPRLYPSESDFEAVKTDRPYYCLAPTSVWFTKQFPLERWMELIDKLPHHHTVYLLGAKGDSAICDSIVSNSKHPNVVNMAGQLSFLKSAALMAGARMNYVNDSAPLHIASAMNAPVRAMFCSTVPAFGYTPLSDDSLVIETEHRLECRPCGLHGKKACPQGHFKCGDISVDRIIALSHIEP